MVQHSSIVCRSSFSEDALSRCDQVVTDFVERLGNLGAQVAIDIEDVGRFAFTAGHSDLARSRAVQTGDIYQIGSQSKTVTAMLLFLLARDGLFRLDDRARDFIDLAIDSRITVRHLLMNMSGLGEYTFALLSNRVDPTVRYEPRDLLAMALPQGQIFEPGSQFDYCNTGWVIAALIAEVIGGKGYGELVNERIARPLGLKNSAFGGCVPTGEFMQAFAVAPDRAAPVDVTVELSWAFGAGDGLASASDICLLYKSLIKKESPLGISLEDLAAMSALPGPSPYFAMSFGTEYGLGLERRFWAGSEVWGHPGSTGACRSSTWIDAERRVTVATAVTIDPATSHVPDDIRYPRAQLFSMALNTAYALTKERT